MSSEMQADAAEEHSVSRHLPYTHTTYLCTCHIHCTHGSGRQVAVVRSGKSSSRARRQPSGRDSLTRRDSAVRAILMRPHCFQRQP